MIYYKHWLDTICLWDGILTTSFKAQSLFPSLPKRSRLLRFRFLNILFYIKLSQAKACSLSNISFWVSVLWTLTRREKRSHETQIQVFFFFFFFFFFLNGLLSSSHNIT